jgi:hypothetical protein
MENSKNVISQMKCVLVCFCFVLIAMPFTSHAIADGTQSDTDDISQAKINAANARLLQKTVQEQQVEIASLQAQIAALKAQLESMGLAPVNSTTTQPISEKPRRIIFIEAVNTLDVDAEVQKAVDQFTEDQWFNVYTMYGNTVYPFQPHFVEATDANKKKFHQSSEPNNICGSLLNALNIAAKVHPDLIWLVGPPYQSPNEDSFLHDLHQTLNGTNVRIDTAIDFLPHSAQDLHLYWRISHETNGICVDKNGNPMDEPPLPLSSPPVAPQPQPQTPTILKDSP